MWNTYIFPGPTLRRKPKIAFVFAWLRTLRTEWSLHDRGEPPQRGPWNEEHKNGIG